MLSSNFYYTVHVFLLASCKEGKINKYYSLNSLCFILFSDYLIRLIIETSDLNEEQRKHVYDMLVQQVTNFIKVRKHSKVEVQGVRALLDFLKGSYSVCVATYNLG